MLKKSPAFEKIRDVSPDGKFAVRISCSGEPGDPEKIDPDLIRAVELVALPSKTTVIKNLGQNYSGTAPEVIWSENQNG
jgi:hypothetical protein